jgi:hypothetical protein
MRSLACVLLLLLTSSAYADDGDKERCEQAPAKFHLERHDGRLIHVLETPIIICHHVPRPSVAYVTDSKSINYEWEKLKQDFLPQILASVTKAPF